MTQEYISLRNEVNKRIVILHQIINLAVILLFLLFLFFTILYSLKVQIIELLLFIPPIFSLLTFNYQANQMTLEAVARYSDVIIKKEKDNSWDDFYGDIKQKNKFTSFLKILPLILPQIVPLIYYINQSEWQGINILFWLDIVLLVLCVINFRYKLKV